MAPIHLTVRSLCVLFGITTSGQTEGLMETCAFLLLKIPNRVMFTELFQEFVLFLHECGPFAALHSLYNLLNFSGTVLAGVYLKLLAVTN